MSDEYQGDPRDGVIEGEVLSGAEAGREVEAIDTRVIAGLTRAEIDVQIATAHKYRRSLTTVMRQIETFATLDTETATSCFFRKPQKERKKNPQTGRWETVDGYLEGPSIRFAEIVMQAWGNGRVASRVTDMTETEIEATGVFHDLESNVAWAKSVRSPIVGTSGARYPGHLVTTTGNAAAAKAIRNAIFAGVPRGIWNRGYQAALAAAKGTRDTVPERRKNLFAKAKEENITQAEIYAMLGVKGEADIGIDELFDAAALLTAVRDGEATIAELIALKQPAVDERGLSEAFGGRAASPPPPPPPAKETAAKNPPKATAARAAAAAKATSGSATDASKGSPASSGSGQQQQSGPTGDGSPPADEIQGGVAGPGEAYFFGADVWADDGMRPVYRDGEQVGRADRTLLEDHGDDGRLFIFANHAPSMKPAAGDGKVVDLAGRRDPVRESNDRVIEQTQGLPKQEVSDEEARADRTNPNVEREPGADEDAEIDTAEFNAFASAVQETTGWPDFKGVVVAFRDSPAFAAAPADLQKEAMLLAFDHASEKGFGFPAPEADVTWYRLWLWTITEETRGHARPAFRKLMRGGQFLSLPEAERNLIVDETTAASGE